jgi:hypothetical protein
MKQQGVVVMASGGEEGVRDDAVVAVYLKDLLRSFDNMRVGLTQAEARVWLENMQQSSSGGDGSGGGGDGDSGSGEGYVSLSEFSSAIASHAAHHCSKNKAMRRETAVKTATATGVANPMVHVSGDGGQVDAEQQQEQSLPVPPPVRRRSFL